MDFSYSEEQRMLTDSLRRLVADNWTRPKRRARQEAGKLDQAAWNSLVELGMGGLLVPDTFGGFGETPATMLAVHQELGRGLRARPALRLQLLFASPTSQHAVTSLFHAAQKH